MVATTQVDVPTRYSGVSSSQFIALCVLGIVLFLIAAILLRIVGPMGAYEGWGRIALYGLTIPGTLPFLLIIRKVLKLRNSQMAVAGAIMTMTATLADGIALAWFPQLYGGTTELIAGAGGAILWGAGVGLTLGFLLNKND
ncbi:MAG: hypothetical protein AAF311_06160 [Pseudomonadota bacterium]